MAFSSFGWLAAFCATQKASLSEDKMKQGPFCPNVGQTGWFGSVHNDSFKMLLQIVMRPSGNKTASSLGAGP